MSLSLLLSASTMAQSIKGSLPAGSSGPSAPASDTGCQHLAASCEPPWRLPLAEPQLTTIHSRHWPAHGD